MKIHWSCSTYLASAKLEIYATPFTAILVQEKFKEKKIDISNKIKIVKLNSKITLDRLKLIL